MCGHGHAKRNADAKLRDAKTQRRKDAKDFR